MRGPGIAGLLVLAGLALILAGLPGQATSPQQPSWSPATLQGGPVGVGFLAGENATYIAYGTGDAGSSTNVGTGACTAQGGDADFYLFHVEEGCVEARDASGSEVGREGVIALTTAERADRVTISLAPSSVPQAQDANLVALDLEGGNLSTAFTKSLPGPVLVLDTDVDGQRLVAGFQRGERPATASYRMNVYALDGERTHGFSLRGTPRAVDLSANARYIAIGGNYTSGNTTFGWVHVYDLAKSNDANPVLTREFKRAQGGIVASVAVTDEGRTYTAHRDGQVAALRSGRSPLTLQVGNGTAHVAASPDGSLVVAAAGGQAARLTGVPEQLAAAWTAPVNGTARDVIVRAPHVFVVADETTGLAPGGVQLWTTAGGALGTASADGLTLALGQDAGTTSGGAQLSQLAGAILHRGTNLTQADAPPTVPPGGVGVVNLTLTNSGAAILNATVQAEAVPHARVDIAPDRVTVLPGRERTLKAAVQVDTDAQPGPTRIPLTVTGTPAVEARTNLTVDVGARTNVSLFLEPGTISEQAVARGQSITVRFLVSNQGNTPATAQLALRQSLTRGASWPATLSPSGAVEVPERTTTTVRLDVDVPEGAPNGTTNRLLVTARTDEGRASASLTLTVNPFQALSLSPQTITKRMAPGTSATYNFTVQNLGSIPANITLTAQAIDQTGDPYVPTDWGIALNRSEVSLSAGRSAGVRLQLTGPSNTTAADSNLRVQLLATTDKGVQASSLAFGVVDPALAADGDEEPKRDPIPFIAPLAALAAGAAFLRRCGHGKV